MNLTKSDDFLILFLGFAISFSIFCYSIDKNKMNDEDPNECIHKYIQEEEKEQKNSMNIVCSLRLLVHT